MKKLFTLFLAFVASAGILFADEAVQIGELYYYLNNSNWTAEVTNNGADPNYELSTITIPSSVSYLSYTYAVTSIGDGAFFYCSSLLSIAIPNSVTSIGGAAFSYCSSLLSIAIPNSVTSIGESAFSDCSSLTSVIIPNSVTNIGDVAFIYCNSLESIVVETGNVVYDNRDNCNAIIETATNKLITGCQSTTIPNSVTSIGNWAFGGCSGLISITIPSSLTSIGHGAFHRCSGLMSISVEAGNSVYDSRDNCNAIIETATNTLFLGCKGTTIPSSVTSIGNWAFDGCSGLISITIPSSLTSIGDGAFSYCSNLTTITCNAETPPSLGSAVFMGLNCATISLYVPAQSVDAYKAADRWKDFNVQAISEDALPEILTDENALDDKFIIDGVLYIRKDGRVYDINGIIVE